VGEGNGEAMSSACVTPSCRTKMRRVRENTDVNERDCACRPCVQSPGLPAHRPWRLPAWRIQMVKLELRRRTIAVGERRSDGLTVQIDAADGGLQRRRELAPAHEALQAGEGPTDFGDLVDRIYPPGREMGQCRRSPQTRAGESETYRALVRGGPRCAGSVESDGPAGGGPS
jgi:hypothetical protein